MSKRHIRFLISVAVVFVIAFVGVLVLRPKRVAAFAGPDPGRIEQAMFTRAEFFGANALISLPTSEVRDNLARITADSPDNTDVLERLAEAEERLGDFDAAEKHLV